MARSVINNRNDNNDNNNDSDYTIIVDARISSI